MIRTEIDLILQSTGGALCRISERPVISGRGFLSSKSRSALLEVEIGRFTLIRMLNRFFVRVLSVDQKQTSPKSLQLRRRSGFRFLGL